MQEPREVLVDTQSQIGKQADNDIFNQDLIQVLSFWKLSECEHLY